MKRLFSIWIFTLVGVVQIFAQPFAFDFSYVGYQQSEKEIPGADVVVFVKWKEGDQSARIQKAIDFVSARKMDKKTGLRGAVLLGKGVFELSQPLRIQTSGVVLRGTDRNQTVLYKKRCRPWGGGVSGKRKADADAGRTNETVCSLEVGRAEGDTACRLQDGR